MASHDHIIVTSKIHHLVEPSATDISVTTGLRIPCDLPGRGYALLLYRPAQKLKLQVSGVSLVTCVCTFSNGRV